MIESLANVIKTLLIKFEQYFEELIRPLDLIKGVL